MVASVDTAQLRFDIASSSFWAATEGPVTVGGAVKMSTDSEEEDGDRGRGEEERARDRPMEKYLEYADLASGN